MDPHGRGAELRKSLLEPDTNEDGTLDRSGRDRDYRRRDKDKRDSVKKRPSTWYVFDNLSSQQGEDLLRQHGFHASYLVSHFHDPKSYQLIIRLDEASGHVFKHYSIKITNKAYLVEGISGSHHSLEEAILAVEEGFGIKLVPIFNQYNCQTCDDDDLTISLDTPPDYTPAQKYPDPPKRALPVIIPIRPTLRRLEQAAATSTDHTIEGHENIEHVVEHGCCWKAFHTDPEGRWFKPHKAGPITAVALVLGWIIFLVLFGWIILLALVLVGALILCAYALNFICTGRCAIEDDDI